ncbi:hypothetical protein Pla123a_00280 [Posidoniimonas polymericola]|uniref:DUF1570 domain-containing protein n=1 Tax=Posidoniimonas polymericola TaxID=2528002 RepID=A0A5C5ZD25_9BACT|nr:hypothetical protein [Posidoniimonas polymericola]TWT85222.1 hypothetical protein Pla123a_00280 [Posidoniimonas polymericola]
MRLILLAILLALPCAAVAATSDALRGAVDSTVDVTLTSGVCYEDATLLRVVGNDAPEKVRLRLSAGRLRTIDLADIDKISTADATLFSGAGDRESGGSEADTETMEPAAELTRAELRKLTREERRAALEAAAKRRADIAKRNWLARLAANSVKAWPEVGEREHQAALRAYKEKGAEAQRLMPELRLYETGRFLFYSNIPADDVGPIIERLDQMYDWMLTTYNLPRDAQVWLGKAPVYAFLTKEQFVAYERQFFQNNPQDGTYGLCHQTSGGEVVITCYRGQQLDEFAAMLVHETSHGFIHRYKTMQGLPSWVNEGMADYIGSLMVPKSRAVPLRESKLVERFKQNPTIARTFFDDSHIGFGDYGLASSLARFMIQTNGDAYAAFVEGMKAGLKWDEALREAYHSEPVDLINAYARWLGVEGLEVR